MCQTNDTSLLFSELLQLLKKYYSLKKIKQKRFFFNQFKQLLKYTPLPESQFHWFQVLQMPSFPLSSSLINVKLVISTTYGHRHCSAFRVERKPAINPSNSKTSPEYQRLTGDYNTPTMYEHTQTHPVWLLYGLPSASSEFSNVYYCSRGKQGLPQCCQWMASSGAWQVCAFLSGCMINGFPPLM